MTDRLIIFTPIRVKATGIDRVNERHLIAYLLVARAMDVDCSTSQHGDPARASSCAEERYPSSLGFRYPLFNHDICYCGCLCWYTYQSEPNLAFLRSGTRLQSESARSFLTRWRGSAYTSDPRKCWNMPPDRGETMVGIPQSTGIDLVLLAFDDGDIQFRNYRRDTMREWSSPFTNEIVGSVIRLEVESSCWVRNEMRGLNLQTHLL